MPGPADRRFGAAGQIGHAAARGDAGRCSTPRAALPGGRKPQVRRDRRSEARLEGSARPEVECHRWRAGNTADGWWLLRASNTQDVLVARAESESRGRARPADGADRRASWAASGLERGPQRGALTGTAQPHPAAHPAAARLACRRARGVSSDPRGQHRRMVVERLYQRHVDGAACLRSGGADHRRLGRRCARRAAFGAAAGSGGDRVVCGNGAGIAVLVQQYRADRLFPGVRYRGDPGDDRSHSDLHADVFARRSRGAVHDLHGDGQFRQAVGRGAGRGDCGGGQCHPDVLQWFAGRGWRVRRHQPKCSTPPWQGSTRCWWPIPARARRWPGSCPRWRPSALRCCKALRRPKACTRSMSRP
jgi:hypothetical protein